MDVRCPNCESEYELDEARLRPGGVTVKCANCEHVFRVRKRGDSALSNVKKMSSTTQASTGSQEEDRTWLVRLADGEIKVCRELATLQRWIVSGIVTPDCEISRTGKKWKALNQLKELSSFFSIAQEAKDVASGKMSAPGSSELAVQGTQVSQSPAPERRPHTVSRNIKEEGAFDESYNDEMTLRLAEQPFLENEQDTVEMSADQAGVALAASRAPSDPGDTLPSIQPNLVRATAKAQSKPPGLPPSVPKPKNATMLGTAVSAIPQVPAKPKRPATEPPPPPPRAPRSAPPVQASLSSQPSHRDSSQPMSTSRSGRTSSVPPPAPPQHSPPQQSFGQGSLGQASAPAPAQSFSSAGPIPPSNGPSGPTGGLGKHIPVSDVAFGASSIGEGESGNSKEFKDGQFVASDSFATPVKQSSGAGKWIVLVSLLLIGGAAAVLYVVLNKKDGKDSGEKIAQTQKLDGGTAVVNGTSDAAPSSDNDKPASVSDSLSVAIDRFDRQELEPFDGLSDIPEGDERDVAQARLNNAVAQFDLDEGVLDPKVARKRKKTSRKLANDAKKLAEGVIKRDANNLGALLAHADALRLSGATSRSVERSLRKASAITKDLPEERYLSAMLRLRDRRVRDAETILKKLQSSDSTSRLKIRLAMINVVEKDYSAAKAVIDEISGMDSEHKTAGQLLAYLVPKIEPEPSTDGDDDDDDDGTDVVATGPDTNPDPGETTPDANPDTTPDRNSGGGDSYDRLLERADKAAETGSCKQAVKLYEQALDVNPSGVAALTGLGYCHLDFKNYASAQARFRAALGISSRYQDALWGVAEAYQQQGLKTQAIVSYRTFIEKHPSSRRADMAKRQIERLGGSLTPEPKPDEPESNPTPEKPEATEPEKDKGESAGDPTPTPEPTSDEGASPSPPDDTESEAAPN